jgi:hypothetical protein
MQRFFKQFSFQGGVGSHATPKRREASTRAASSDTAYRTRTGQFTTARI